MSSDFLRHSGLVATAALAAGLVLGGIAHAAGNSGNTSNGNEGKVELGYLECQLSSDEGNVLVSELAYNCVFKPNSDDRQTEIYKGTSEKIGIDLSKTEQETLRWAVLAAGYPDETGALAGDYGGVSADASAGAGVGAKVLVGGFEGTITLQPLSISTQEGYGLSVAIESFDLDYVGTTS